MILCLVKIRELETFPCSVLSSGIFPAIFLGFGLDSIIEAIYFVATSASLVCKPFVQNIDQYLCV